MKGGAHIAYVGVGWRAVAVIVDAVVFLVIGYLVALATGSVTATGFELRGGPAFLTFLLWFGYAIAMEATLGATMGKLLLGLRVVTVDGAPVGWQKAIVRNALRLVDGLLVYLVAAILVWRSPLRQRLGDRVAGTVVVRAGGAPAASAGV